MSRSLMVYSSDFAAVVAAAGSQDRGLVKQLVRSDDSPELQVAIEELVMRTGPHEKHNSMWLAFAQERLCAAYGQSLSNDAVSGTSLSRLETLDEGLVASGLGLTLQELMYGGGPIASLPWPDDFPSTGTWPPEIIGPALELYDRLSPTSDDDAVDELLVCIGDWLRTARARGYGLVGFYY